MIHESEILNNLSLIKKALWIEWSDMIRFTIPKLWDPQIESIADRIAKKILESQEEIKKHNEDGKNQILRVLNSPLSKFEWIILFIWWIWWNLFVWWLLLKTEIWWFLWSLLWWEIIFLCILLWFLFKKK